MDIKVNLQTILNGTAIEQLSEIGEAARRLADLIEEFTLGKIYLSVIDHDDA